MLAHTTLRLRPRTLALARRCSSSDYHSKVRAFPFKIDEHEAIRALAPFASVSCMFKEFVGSFGAFLLPSIPGFKPIQPSRIQPIYFPSWIIDAEFEAHPIPKSEEKAPASAFLSDSYMPGNVYDPLVRLSFNSNGLKQTDPVPFTKNLLNQHGRDVVCLPYNISPCALPDLARSMSHIEINKAMRLDPSTLKKFEQFAAYPILIPLYLARYEFELDEKIFQTTAVLEAFDLQGRVMMEENPAFNDLPRNAFTDFIKPETSQRFEFWNGDALPFAKVDLLASRAFTHDIFLSPSAELSKWLEDKMKRPDVGKELYENCPLDMNDPRVREYTPAEVQANREWLAMGVDIITFEMLKSGMTIISNTGQPANGRMEHPQTPEAAQMIGAHLESLERNRAKHNPPWAKELFSGS